MCTESGLLILGFVKTITKKRILTLQNLVNHRVFEHKLCPKPLARARLPGHHALRFPDPSSYVMGKEDGLPCLTGCGWPKIGAHNCELL